MKNLQTAFPEKSERELKRISRQSYRHLCDLFLEMVKSINLSVEKMQERFTCTNIEDVNSLLQKKTPVIAMLGHHANYEWSIGLMPSINFPVFVIYKPLKNKYFDTLVHRIREKFNAQLIPMRSASKTINASVNDNKPVLIAMIADQSPSKSRVRYFTDFFGTPTAAFLGAENIAQNSGIPVLYLSVEKLRRGFYRSTFKAISSGTDQSDLNQITDNFFSLLEEDIRKAPALYLWSHKRWKYRPEDMEIKPRLSDRLSR